MRNTTTKPPVTRSSGNVFHDLEVAEPAEALAKSELAALIARALRARRFTQTAAGKVLGIDQPKVSELMRGRLTRFSTERLMAFLVRLGRDVEIVVREPRSDRATLRGRIRVRATRPRRVAKIPADAPRTPDAAPSGGGSRLL
jgi:predicted XRE-type DNA-binding protein